MLRPEPDLRPEQPPQVTSNIYSAFQCPTSHIPTLATTQNTYSASECTNDLPCDERAELTSETAGRGFLGVRGSLLVSEARVACRVCTDSATLSKISHNGRFFISGGIL